jgi:NAD(P)-dependent dehydrogenase (short-subunit alcohol dehydrogenase family)
MASILGFVGDPDLAAYCAAKGGVIALTKAGALTRSRRDTRELHLSGDVETPLLKDYFNKIHIFKGCVVKSSRNMRCVESRVQKSRKGRRLF